MLRRGTLSNCTPGFAGAARQCPLRALADLPALHARWQHATRPHHAQQTTHPHAHDGWTTVADGHLSQRPAARVLAATDAAASPADVEAPQPKAQAAPRYAAGPGEHEVLLADFMGSPEPCEP